MPRRRYSWTQPCCWDCWDLHYPSRMPVRVKDPELERCVYCGGLAKHGIYIRISPDAAPFPSIVKD